MAWCFPNLEKFTAFGFHTPSYVGYGYPIPMGWNLAWVDPSVQLVAVSLLGDEMVTCKNKSVIWSDAVPWCDEWRQSRINSHEPTVWHPFWFSYAYFIACSPLQAPAYLFTAVILLRCVSLGLGCGLGLQCSAVWVDVCLVFTFGCGNRRVWSYKVIVGVYDRGRLISDAQSYLCQLFVGNTARTLRTSWTTDRWN